MLGGESSSLQLCCWNMMENGGFSVLAAIFVDENRGFPRTNPDFQSKYGDLTSINRPQKGNINFLGLGYGFKDSSTFRMTPSTDVDLRKVFHPQNVGWCLTSRSHVTTISCMWIKQ